jgi:oxygen-independent coproporphyrinogen-3 oxidase
MGLSVYVHIPYCLQRCRYCDFTTFEWSEILPPEKYVEQVLQEIRNRHHLWQDREIATLYFGGGTPSLIAPELIVAITRELANVGFKFSSDSELTLEINPATIREESLDIYQAAGFNRFSVGAQSFDDGLLALCGRKHNAADTRHTLQLLKNRNVNYSFDLLFALPSQTIQQLDRDLDEVLKVQPPHLSAYCLTVPESHPMSLGRPPEDEQVEMFELIERRLKEIGILKYEISNFSKPGLESRHNLTYWEDRSYWGIGLSAHSYGPQHSDFGTRFWNPKKLDVYAQQVSLKGCAFSSLLPSDQWEQLKEHESLTDFCHMHLRTMRGLHESALRKKFSTAMLSGLWARLENLTREGLLQQNLGSWSLTNRGCLISNQVFERLTFLASSAH